MFVGRRPLHLNVYTHTHTIVDAGRGQYHTTPPHPTPPTNLVHPLAVKR